MIWIHIQGKPFNATVIQVYGPTIVAKTLKLNSSRKIYNEDIKTYKAFKN